MTKNAWNTPFPSANGQLLIGSGAGVPAWATLTQGTGTTITNGAGSISIAFDSPTQGFTLLSSASASASSAITFTGLSSTYSVYMIEMEGVAPATDDVDFWIRTSTNNGSSYDSGASDYAWTMYGTSSAGLDPDSDGADSEITLVAPTNEQLGTGTQENLAGRLWLLQPSATQYAKLLFNTNYTDLTGDFAGCDTGGIRLTAADVDAIQFLMSSGNIATGEFRLYGFTA